ncbi:MAG: NAD-dependent epimerase/dehydratase family protein [Thermodesulfovibrio sp.]|nr:NAD-dependent epimerase/dehydratase family protein [Thermodesulfovibrio sp.]
MKITVTGATGFIGKAVLKEFKALGIPINGITRNNPDIIEKLGHTPIILDIKNPKTDIFDVIGKPDILIHLAWDGLKNYNSPHHYEVEYPAHYLFLKNLIMQGLRNIIVAGTCLEYGIKYGPISETCLCNPTTPYGFAKDALRRSLEFLRDRKAFNFTWMRIFYLYGDEQPNHTLFGQLRKAVQEGREYFDMSYGDQLRDYMEVREVARIIVKLALMQKNIGVINICSGKPVSVRSLVESWLAKNNFNIKLNLGAFPMPSYESKAFWGDDSKLKALLSHHE